MQQNTNSKWLHRFFVFLLAIMVVGSYTIPQSFGMFGAQEAKAAEGSPTPIPGTNGTIDILDGSGNSISDDGLSIRGANKTTEPYEYQIRVVIDGLTGKEGRTVKVEMAEGLMIQNAGLSESNVVNATTNV